MADLLSIITTLAKTGHNKRYPGKPIAETITNGFFTVDRKWTVRYWNKAAEKLLGVPATDILGKNLWEKFAGIIPLDFYAVYHRAFLQDIPVHFEEYWGEMGAWFDVIAYHCDDTLSVSFKNCEQQKKPVNPELEALNELYKFVTEITNDCLWEWDLRSQELFWIDGGHKRVFGYQIENALIPQNFWESRIHADDKLRVLESLTRILVGEQGVDWEIEYRFMRSNGDYAYVHDRGHIIYSDGIAVRMIGATQDISTRKLTEIKLFESEKKLSLIARQIFNAIIITNAAGDITWVNNAFTRLTEYEPGEVIGSKMENFLYGKGTETLTVEYLKGKMRSKEPFDYDIINYSKSGRKYWAHVQGQALCDEEGKCEEYFAIQTDITERVALESKLVQERMANQKEITAAVLTAQETERASIGRELHDNLNQILGAANLYIEMAAKDNDNRVLYLNKSTTFIVNVIEEIRSISKSLAAPGIYATGLFAGIRNLIDDLVLIYPMKIGLEVLGVKEQNMDEMLQLNIFRIIQEQLNNILKHSAATLATIKLSRNGKKIILFISDNGRGFDIAATIKGVGIRNIMSRAELCNGKAEIVSKAGQGFQLRVVFRDT